MSRLLRSAHASVLIMYLVNLVENIYAWDVDSTTLYAVHQIINITVFFQVDICIVYPVL